ncbi:MAG: hypothetical protein DI613_10465 [Kocuria rhizophila]|nr:MAG: hypothetical protein DI613_10465 [Kocuria rhizophila]
MRKTYFDCFLLGSTIKPRLFEIPPKSPKVSCLMKSLPPDCTPNFPHDELPQVDIRAVAFHRWRTLKWLVSFVEPNSPCAREGHARTFDAALQLAKTWSLAYWAKHYGISELLNDAPPLQLNHADVDKDSSTIQ